MCVLLRTCVCNLHSSEREVVSVRKLTRSDVNSIIIICFCYSSSSSLPGKVRRPVNVYIFYTYLRKPFNRRNYETKKGKIAACINIDPQSKTLIVLLHYYLIYSISAANSPLIFKQFFFPIHSPLLYMYLL